MAYGSVHWTAQLATRRPESTPNVIRETGPSPATAKAPSQRCVELAEGHPDDRLGQVQASRRTLEVSTRSEGEDTTVRSDEVVPVAGGSGGDAHDGCVEPRSAH